MTQSSKPQTCIVKMEQQGNMPCGRLVRYFSAEQAQEQGRGQYSGWRHVSPVPDEDHNAVPSGWI